jgi:hypothetical protein
MRDIDVSGKAAVSASARSLVLAQEVGFEVLDALAVLVRCVRCGPYLLGFAQ